MLTSHEQNAGQNYNMATALLCEFEGTSNVYLRTTVTHQKWFPEIRIISRNGCYQSICNLLSSHKHLILLLLHMGVKPGLSYCRKNKGWVCSRTECWIRYFGLSDRDQQETEEKYILRGFMICIPHQINFGWSSQWGWPIGPIQLTLEDGTDRLYRNVGNYQSKLRNNPEERRSHWHIGRSLKSRTVARRWLKCRKVSFHKPPLLLPSHNHHPPTSPKKKS